MIIASWLPVFILLIGFAAGFCCLLIPERQLVLRNIASLGFALAGIALIIAAAFGVAQNADFTVKVPFLPQASFALHIDALSILFSTLTGVLWLLTSIYAIGYLTHYKNKSRFFGFIHLSVAATLGIALSANLITFVIFYETLTLATFPLVAHKGNDASLDAARLYLRYTIVGCVMLLAGAIWLTSVGGHMPFTPTGVLSTLEKFSESELTLIFALLITGLGVKAALVPLHSWLPAAMAAPAPVSALLHAVAVVKAGAFGIVRIVYDIFGIEFARDLGLTFYLAIAASITIIYGSVLALKQMDIKKRLAFSTVSQVSYIALGTAIAGPIATIGGLIHLVHQGLMKITLFFCAGILAERLGITRVDKLDGAGKLLPLPMIAFTVASLGMIGVPPVAGFVSKWYLSTGAIEVGAFWVVGVLTISALLNACYFLPLLYRIWFKPLPAEQSVKTHPYSILMTIPAVITALFAILAGLLANLSISPLNWAKLIASREYARTFVYPDTFSPHADYLLPIVIVLPLIWLAVCLIAKQPKLLNTGAVFLALPVIALALSGTVYQFSMESLFFSSHFSLNAQNQYFLLLCGLVWAFAFFYARGYFSDSGDTAKFNVWAMLAFSGNIGLILANDYFAFITFYTLMSLAAYGLVIFTLQEDAKVAARSYIRWAILAELLLFAGFSLLAQWQSVLENTDLQQVSHTLLLVGFGIKLGMIGLHFWLPLAHPAAPIPASAVLSGAMVKAGLMGIIKFLPELSPELGSAMIYLGVAGIVAGAVLGLFQQQPKAILAYSTISQMGVVTSGLGSAVVYGIDWSTLTLCLAFYCLHHGIVKAALFFCVAAVPSNKKWSFHHWCIVVLPAIALPGLPFTGAMLAKEQLSTVVRDPVTEFGLAASVVATSMLMLHFVTTLRHQSHSSCSGSNHVTIVALLLSIISPFTLWLLPEVAEAVSLTWSTHSKTLLLVLAASGGYFLFNRYSHRFLKHTQNLIPFAIGDIPELKQTRFRFPNVYSVKNFTKISWQLPSIRFEYGLILFLAGMFLSLIMNIVFP